MSWHRHLDLQGTLLKALADPKLDWPSWLFALALLIIGWLVFASRPGGPLCDRPAAPSQPRPQEGKRVTAADPLGAPRRDQIGSPEGSLQQANPAEPVREREADQPR